MVQKPGSHVAHGAAAPAAPLPPHLPGDDLHHHGVPLDEPRSPVWLPIVGIVLLATLVVWWLSGPSAADDAAAAAAAASASSAAAAASGSSSNAPSTGADVPGARPSMTAAPMFTGIPR